jgi:hypothetical protein
MNESPIASGRVPRMPTSPIPSAKAMRLVYGGGGVVRAVVLLVGLADWVAEWYLPYTFLVKTRD